MKNKITKKIIHTLTKKKLAKRKASKRLARLFFITITALCSGSLAISVAATKPSSVGLQIGGAYKASTRIPLPQIAPVKVPGAPDQIGQASWYALGLPSPDSLTCASTTFGRGSYLEVKNVRNGKTVTCLVNDYGPEAWTNRAIDLSRGSFRVVEDLGRGTMPVEIRVVSRPSGLNIDATKLLSTVMGYNLCKQTNTIQFCELNRLSTQQFGAR